MHLRLFSYRKFSSLRQLDPLSSIGANIRSFVQHGLYSEALQLYYNGRASLLSSQKSEKFTFPSLFKACAALLDFRHGSKIHATIICMGLQYDAYIASSLIKMYVKCGYLDNAVKVFVSISECEDSVNDVTLWNSIIDGYFQYGFIHDAFLQFRLMQSLGVRPDGYSLSILLQICSKSCNLVGGRQIHSYVVRQLLDGDPYLETALIDMYAKCCRPLDSWRVFDRMEDKSNDVPWNAMICGFCENGLWEKSLEFFVLMKSENCKLGSATFSSVLTACSDGEDMDFGRAVHCNVIKIGLEWDPYVYSSLLSMYARGRTIEDAQKVFYQKPDKETELWNAMISGYIFNNSVEQALDVYRRMRFCGLAPNSFTISNVLAACSLLDLHDFGRSVHGELIKIPAQCNVAVQSALLTLYVKCGNTEDAHSVFNAMEQKDVVSWGSMISGLCQNGNFREALNLFKAMEAEGQGPDPILMGSVISACVGLQNLELACGFHGIVLKSGMGLDAFVGCNLIETYAKFGLPEMSGNVFAEMSHKNLVCWNSIISCYLWNDLPELSINLFPQLVQHGLTPDSVSITNILVAITSVAALLKGKAVHAYQTRHEIQTDLQAGNALIDMYVKCGCLQNAQKVFEKMPQRNIVTWNSMIAGNGSHGECMNAIALFDEMQRLGVIPDDVTFLALISSCSHSGFIEKGLNIFQSMTRDYGIEPRMEHYANMTDLWGRAGHLTEAYSFIQSMPIVPDKSVWLCLLYACRAHHNIELGELAAHNLLNLDPDRGSNYVQLLNLYGEAALWDKAANLRVSMKDKGLKKHPGYSWIEVRNKVDVFFSGDSSSPRAVEIYNALRSLRTNMRRESGNEEIMDQ
ncbi:pentatricopeptide repeat-containing protein At2g40720 [Macadamia integrifolia]|uniref:pentatricopeptide repeat-containing protein At2g40720 n=1 Tax=Macadamia integrifolia TaxID=60698 RepID=UPI001C4E8B2C|nr:pentatricopeptide repeat-containing protein At2g40720 [Macadamia integrifolia]